MSKNCGGRVGQSSLGLGCPDDGCVHYFLVDRGVDHYLGIECRALFFPLKQGSLYFCAGVFVGVGHGKNLYNVPRHSSLGL